jgi:hypothetical protein
MSHTAAAAVKITEAGWICWRGRKAAARHNPRIGKEILKIL